MICSQNDLVIILFCLDKKEEKDKWEEKIKTFFYLTRIN